MKRKPTFSVIILNHNAKTLLKQCLKSILDNTSADCEIVIVDNGSTDGSKEYLRQLSFQHPKLKIATTRQNLGAAKGRNIGAKLAQGEYLFFLDVDTQVEEDFVSPIEQKFRQDPHLGAIQAKLLLGQSNKIDSIGHFLTPFGFPYEIGHGENALAYQQEQVIFAGRTAALAVRREVFNYINGFDEDYFIYGEDTDLCWRIWLAGYRVIFLPHPRVRHYSKSSLNPATYRRIFFEGAKNHTCNILKNASFSKLLWLLPLHLAGWALIGTRLIFSRRFAEAAAILQGLWWNLISLPQTIRKRRTIDQLRKKNNQAEKYLFGKIELKELIQQGWRWLKNV